VEHLQLEQGEDIELVIKAIHVLPVKDYAVNLPFRHKAGKIEPSPSVRNPQFTLVCFG
jgi:hypothetical protein